MTTYFFKNPDGSVHSRMMDNDLSPWDPHHRLVTGINAWPAVEYNQQLSTSLPAISNSMFDYGYGDEHVRVNANNTYYSGSEANPLHQYPDLDLIRNHHSLYSILSFIEPSRLHNALSGPFLNIVEEETARTFAIGISKKMMVLFCGRKMINKFLRTLEPEDNTTWKGGSMKQELRFPPGYTNRIGMKILIAWMVRACRQELSKTKHLRVPKSLFAAISLSRALTALGLHRDANWVDQCVASNHYMRPMYIDDIVSIWNCLPKDSKYTYRMVEELRKKMYEYSTGNKNALLEADRVFAFLEEQPDFKTRIENNDQNICEEHRSGFGTDCCVRAASKTQKKLTTTVGPEYDDGVAAEATGGDTCNDHGNLDKYRIDLGDREKGTKKVNSHTHTQNRKQMVPLSDWQRQDSPSAWPEFDKSVVLRIADL